ncbi:MAG: cobalt ECF transporter T component CbiQ [Cyanophyceae cyanobacterium]
MRWELDRYSHLDSPLHHWDPRAKVVGLAGLMVAFAALERLSLVVPMVVTAGLIYGLSRLPISYLAQRLRYPGLLILSLVVMLPLVSGETVLWHWGWLALRQEGLERMVLVICRFVSILTLSFVLLGTTPFVTLLRSLRSLGLPALMADMMMLSYRYLFEVGDTLATMRQAMKLRGFQLYRPQQGWVWPDLAAVAHVSALLGTLLLRSYDRSEQVYKAMKLRGYGQPVGSRGVKSWPDPWSCLGVGLALVWGVGFVALEYLWL